jgi:hypothetical protein
MARQEACSESLSQMEPSLWDMAGSLPSGGRTAPDQVAAQILVVTHRSRGHPERRGTDSPTRWSGQPIQSAASSAK